MTIKSFWIGVLGLVVHELPSRYTGNLTHGHMLASALKDKWLDCLAADPHCSEENKVSVLRNVITE